MPKSISESAENYLKEILELEGIHGCARTGDIAGRLGIKPPSVTEMLQKLESKGLIEYEQRKGAKLTNKGLKKANRIKARHDVFERFLNNIGVSKENSRKDACRLEHALSDETISKFADFAEKLGKT